MMFYDDDEGSTELTDDMRNLTREPRPNYNGRWTGIHLSDQDFMWYSRAGKQFNLYVLYILYNFICIMSWKIKKKWILEGWGPGICNWEMGRIKGGGDEKDDDE